MKSLYFRMRDGQFVLVPSARSFKWTGDKVVFQDANGAVVRETLRAAGVYVGPPNGGGIAADYKLAGEEYLAD